MSDEPDDMDASIQGVDNLAASIFADRAVDPFLDAIYAELEDEYRTIDAPLDKTENTLQTLRQDYQVIEESYKAIGSEIMDL